MGVSLTEALERTRKARAAIQPLADEAREELAGPDPDIPWSAGVFSTDHMATIEVWKKILQQYREVKRLADRPD